MSYINTSFIVYLHYVQKFLIEMGLFSIIMFDVLRCSAVFNGYLIVVISWSKSDKTWSEQNTLKWAIRTPCIIYTQLSRWK